MPTRQAQRSSVWFGLMLVVTLYVIVSAMLAVATSDVCDGTLHGQKSWTPFPPHWECPSQ
jgi:Na+(H+)/acetate symporter ActP